jgi:hypothetical protein
MEIMPIHQHLTHCHGNINRNYNIHYIQIIWTLFTIHIKMNCICSCSYILQGGKWPSYYLLLSTEYNCIVVWLHPRPGHSGGASSSHRMDNEASPYPIKWNNRSSRPPIKLEPCVRPQTMNLLITLHILTLFHLRSWKRCGWWLR